MDKIKKVSKLENLPDDAVEALLEKYPDGIEDHVRKVTKPNGDFFYAVNVDTETISYLVKIEVDVDFNSDEEKFDLDFLDQKAEREAKNHSKVDGGSDDEGDDDE